IGAIKTTKTEAEMEPTGQVLALYRKEFGTLPVAVTGAAPPLDVAAAFTADRTALTVAVVNPTTETRRVPFDLRGAQLTGAARRFVLTGRDRWAHNAPGQPRGVTVEATSVGGANAAVEAPALSVALYRFELGSMAASAQAAGAREASDRFAIPATDDGLPGAGPIRRYEWFRELWRERRSEWAPQVAQDQNAVVFLGDSITQGWGGGLGA